MFPQFVENGLVVENGTVVHKHGTVVQNTLFHFRSVVEKRNSSAKKRNSGAKNGTAVRKHGTVVQNTLFRICSVVGKRNRSAKKRNSSTKTHCSVFVPLWKKRNSSGKTNSGTKTRNGGTKYTVPFLFHCGKTEQ